MKGEQLTHRLHFYYCAIVALRIFEQGGRSVSALQKNTYLLKWLHHAQCKKLFHPQVFSEISWLRGKVLQQGMRTDSVALLNYIYRYARDVAE